MSDGRSLGVVVYAQEVKDAEEVEHLERINMDYIRLTPLSCPNLKFHGLILNQISFTGQEAWRQLEWLNRVSS